MAVPERPQVIIFATFQGVPKSPPRITRLNELVHRCISCSTAAAAAVLQLLCWRSFVIVIAFINS